MNQNNERFALLTKWVFEANEDPDSPSIISTGDVAGDESGGGLDAYVGPYTGAVDNPDRGSSERPWGPDRFGHEADSVGGWIDETQEGMRIELDLFDRDAPSKERITRSYKLHRMPPLLWL